MILHPAITDVGERYRRVEKSLRDGTLTEADSRYLGTDFTYIYKYHDDRSPELGKVNTSAFLTEEITDDYFPFVATTNSVDRDGDIVLPMGCDLTNFKDNPVVFFGHQEWMVPIGVCRSPDGQITVFPEEERVVSHWYPDKPDPDSMFIAGKVKRKILSAVSIAFVPIQATRREYEKARTNGDHGGSPWGGYSLAGISQKNLSSAYPASRERCCSLLRSPTARTSTSAAAVSCATLSTARSSSSARSWSPPASPTAPRAPTRTAAVGPAGALDRNAWRRAW